LEISGTRAQEKENKNRKAKAVIGRFGKYPKGESLENKLTGGALQD